MKIHYLKTWPEFFEATRSGDKPFDVRVDDRRYEKGDVIVMSEWSPSAESYTGRHLHAQISYVYRGGDHDAPVGLAAPDEVAEPVVLGLTQIHPTNPENIDPKRLGTSFEFDAAGAAI